MHSCDSKGQRTEFSSRSRLKKLVESFKKEFIGKMIIIAKV